MKKYLPLWLKLKNNYSQIVLGLFLSTVLALLYTNLGRDALFDWDEGIYGELGRQIVITKNILTTFWNGAVWMEKPPGIAWLSAIGIYLLGPSSLGARLLMPLVAVYVLYVVYRIGNKIGGAHFGFIAAGVLASLNLFLGRTRAVNTDMALLASISTTVLFLLENKPSWWVALSIFGGIWFKGLAGFISLIIALPLLISKPRKYMISLLIYIFAFVLPWHLYSYLRFKRDFYNPYFIEQVVRRATSQIEFHFENKWYYFNYLYDNLGVGVICVTLIGICSLVLKKKNFFLIWWIMAPLGIYTLAKTRLFWYILPIYPAISLLIAHAITHFSYTKTSQKIIAILSIGILIQATITTSKSVEITKKFAQNPDRIQVAQILSKYKDKTLMVLVPPSERLSEALLPDVAKLSSSFRYGGMPSVVFYFQGNVLFYYDVDKFKDEWQKAIAPLALIAVQDIKYIPNNYVEVAITPTYIGIQKGVYALR